ncbi:divergent polysaccharide deacetylase family protein [Budvicia diplopodorum]|uniref:divergent polysaccharide deacetylase family protein n=1 Tax=Budvicia diplopodorum TaxID=1119056 RepID=UPI00135BBF37|nr:divergent polysaccharide deacetylase family protein [Budvicia diplopodorum]
MTRIGIGITLLLATLNVSVFAAPARLAIVIDDFGYRRQNEEQILQLPAAVSVAILPNAPLTKEMADKAYQKGHEILIHMPMEPISKQPLERDTLRPTMGKEEIQRIIAQAIHNVPHAKGMNNHMGSSMTSDLAAMQRVMGALNHYQLYFLDSMTIGASKSTQAAEGTSVRVVKRKVFLDDEQSDAAVLKQLNLAIRMAQKNGSAIAIGHPHPSTVRVLQNNLHQLPADVVLVPVSALLSKSITPVVTEPPHHNSEKKLPELTLAQRCPAPESIDKINPQLAYQTVKNTVGPSPLTLSLYSYLSYCSVSYHNASSIKAMVKE